MEFKHCGIVGLDCVDIASRAVAENCIPEQPDLRAQFASFIEAMLLHNKILAVGQPSPHHRRLQRRLQAAVGQPILSFIGDKSATKAWPNNNMRKFLGKIFSAGNPPELVTANVLKINHAPRTAADEHERHQAQLQSFITNVTGHTSLDLVSLEEWVRASIDKANRAPELRFTTNYLLRTFVFAGLSRKLKGATHVAGERRVLLHFIEKKHPNPDIYLPQKLFFQTEQAYRCALRSAGERPDQYVSLALDILMTSRPNNPSLLQSMAHLAADLAPFRSRLHDCQDDLLLPEKRDSTLRLLLSDEAISTLRMIVTSGNPRRIRRQASWAGTGIATFLELNTEWDSSNALLKASLKLAALAQALPALSRGLRRGRILRPLMLSVAQTRDFRYNLSSGPTATALLAALQALESAAENGEERPEEKER